MSVFLSIIIPAYNEAKRLPATLKKVAAFIESQPYESEVLIVENGSTDGTLALSQEFAAGNPHFRVVQERKKGKGGAVRRGMLEAKGEYRFMCDADFSMPVDEIPRFLPPEIPNTDIVIGSREAKGAVRYNEPSYRHLGGRGINFLIRLLALPYLQDTQCGFKCYRAEVAEDLFKMQQIRGWSFDIENLFIARRRGYEIIELPIPWYYTPESHVNPIRDAVRLILDIFVIRSNSRNGVYAKKV